MPPETYRLSLPAKRRSCVVFSSPHSGACYPQDFLAQSVLDRQQIRSSEDAFIDDLFSPAPASGAPLHEALSGARNSVLFLSLGVGVISATPSSGPAATVTVNVVPTPYSESI